MADQIQRATTTGATIYALVRDAAGKVFNGSAFETYLTANRGAYDLPMSEQGTASGHYAVAFPASIPAGTYLVSVHNQAGGAPAEGDAFVGSEWIEWDGAVFLARISVLPNLVLNDRVVNHADGTIKIYDANGYLGGSGNVLRTLTLSDVGNNETLIAAS